jgi:hypothetical protein
MAIMFKCANTEIGVWSRSRLFDRPPVAGVPGPVADGGAVGSDVSVECSIVQYVVGVPLSGQLQLRVDHEIVRAAGLMLNGVDVGGDAVVESLNLQLLSILLDRLAHFSILC